MILRELTPKQLAERLGGPGVDLQTGPFVVRLRTDLPELAQALHFLYADFAVDESRFADCHVAVTAPRGLHRWWRPQARFLLDGRSTFEPVPRGWVVPLLEWGLNRCVSRRAHQYLILHAAVVARDGRALVLPGPPGSGKSTLCATLTARGWRHLSDELTLVRPDVGWVVPLPRPISVKGTSIEALRTFVPTLPLGPLVADTRRGMVAHVRPPRDSVRRAAEPALPAWLVFPSYRAGIGAILERLSPARALIQLGQSCFNHSTLGAQGFETLAGLVDRSACYEFAYGRLEDAAQTLDALASR